MTHTFLCEIGCEEIPTSAMSILEESMRQQFTEQLQAAELSYQQLTVFISPRRLAVQVDGLIEEQPMQSLERQGPTVAAAYDKEGMPTIACLGFMRSCGATLDDLQKKQTPKGERVFCHIKREGALAKDLLPDLIHQAINSLVIPKPMHWGHHSQAFVRPVHWLLSLLDENILDVTLFDLSSGRATYGHRFHHPEEIALQHASHYEEALQDAYVIASFGKRKQVISEQMSSLPLALSAVSDDGDLLHEVTTLVEWPQALVGTFDKDFLQLPEEVLTTVMKLHQKCFAIKDKNGALEAKFCTISNLQSPHPEVIIDGNERVMRARLADAQFFYKKDQQQSFSSLAPSLEHIIFHKKLGTVSEKVARIEAISCFLSEKIGADGDVSKAARCCKCDLVTDMVGEFPELQGIMGSYYALAEGSSKEIALAIGEHYLPRYSGDALPSTALGCIIAIADRIDSLVGIIGIGKAPGGAKDPFALRRGALSIIRIIIDKDFDIDLKDMVEKTTQLYAEKLTNQHVVVESVTFIMERLFAYYHEKAVQKNIINAVFAKGVYHLTDFNQRVLAVQAFVDMPQAASLSAASKRVGNILKKQNIKSADKATVKENLLSEAAEKDLYQSLKKLEASFQEDVSAKRYADALEKLATLKDPVDAFFDQVMVMCEDQSLRQNRLHLLSRLHALLTDVADITAVC